MAITNIDNCDALSPNWGVSDNGSISVDTSIKNSGTGSIKMVQNAGAYGLFRRKNFGGADFSSAVKFSCYIYVVDYTKVSNIELYISTDSGDNFFEYIVPSSVYSSNGWKFVEWEPSDMTEVGTPNMASIERFYVYFENSGGYATIHIDTIQYDDSSSQNYTKTINVSSDANPNTAKENNKNAEAVMETLEFIQKTTNKTIEALFDIFSTALKNIKKTIESIVDGYLNFAKIVNKTFFVTKKADSVNVKFIDKNGIELHFEALINKFSLTKFKAVAKSLLYQGGFKKVLKVLLSFVYPENFNLKRIYKNVVAYLKNESSKLSNLNKTILNYATSNTLKFKAISKSRNVYLLKSSNSKKVTQKEKKTYFDINCNVSRIMNKSSNVLKSVFNSRKMNIDKFVKTEQRINVLIGKAISILKSVYSSIATFILFDVPGLLFYKTITNIIRSKASQKEKQILKSNEYIINSELSSKKEISKLSQTVTKVGILKNRLINKIFEIYTNISSKSFSLIWKNIITALNATISQNRIISKIIKNLSKTNASESILRLKIIISDIRVIDYSNRFIDKVSAIMVKCISIGFTLFQSTLKQSLYTFYKIVNKVFTSESKQRVFFTRFTRRHFLGGGKVGENVFEKQNAEKFTVTVDFTASIEENETITSIIVTALDTVSEDATATVIDASSFDGAIVGVKVKNGGLNEYYKITVLANTSESNTYESDVFMRILEV